MNWTNLYKCDDCGEVWSHKWDMGDPNNDYTMCPECFSTDFEEIDNEN